MSLELVYTTWAHFGIVVTSYLGPSFKLLGAICTRQHNSMAWMPLSQVMRVFSENIGNLTAWFSTVKEYGSTIDSTGMISYITMALRF